MQRFKAALVTGYRPDNPEPLVRDRKGDFVKFDDVVEWLSQQRNHVPATGKDFANIFLYDHREKTRY